MSPDRNQEVAPADPGQVRRVARSHADDSIPDATSRISIPMRVPAAT